MKQQLNMTGIRHINNYYLAETDTGLICVYNG